MKEVFHQNFGKPETEEKESMKQKSKERQGGVVARDKLLEELIFEKGMTAEEANKEADKRLGGGETMDVFQNSSS